MLFRTRISRWRGWAGSPVLIAALAIGCGAPATKNNDEPAASDIKKVAASALPPLADYLPPLDDGKIEIAPPEGWKTLAREVKYLARFVKGDPLSMPRLLVTVEPSSFDEFDTVDEGNVEQFAKSVGKRLKDRKAAVLEPARAMLIGDNAYARYVLRSKFRGENIERQMLETIVGGRLYTIDLQVPNEELLKHRDAAYALAAGAKFTGSNDSAAGNPPSAEDSSDP